MESTRILLIQRSGKSGRSFAPALERKGFEVEVANTGKAALEHGPESWPDLVVLDAASLGTSGIRICQDLRKGLNGVPLIHIFPEGRGGSDERSGLADISLEMPFTARKLVNRINRLSPSAHEGVLEVGPVKLTLGTREVECYGKEKRLTPKTARLLELLMRNPGRTLPRGFLMKRVWRTDYVGDTRTLDVHVHWVRKAIEPTPKKPCHVVTIRGVGYRFEPEPSSPS
jgi:DNA-binding response OmpR family regulator